MNSARSEFDLDFKSATHLNHGSFGAVPRRVTAAQAAWRRRMERNPHQFLREELPGHLHLSLSALRQWLGVSDPGAGLVFVRNASEGVATVAAALELLPGDEVLAFSTEYPSLLDLWRDRCDQADATVRLIAPPVGSEADAAALIARSLTDRTRVVFLSHVNSVLSTVVDLAAVAEVTRGQVVLVVDGAHAPGQLEQPLRGFQGSYYVGNLHKWGLFPRGTGFIYCAASRAETLRPLTRSWYYTDPSVERRFSWQGTTDPSAWLVTTDVVGMHVDAALRGWHAAGRRVRDYAVAALTARGGVDPSSRSEPFAPHMASVLFPGIRSDALKADLRGRGVWAWVGEHERHAVLRVSCPWYSDEADVAILERALDEHLEMRS